MRTLLVSEPPMVREFRSTSTGGVGRAARSTLSGAKLASAGWDEYGLLCNPCAYDARSPDAHLAAALSLGSDGRHQPRRARRGRLAGAQLLQRRAVPAVR